MFWLGKTTSLLCSVVFTALSTYLCIDYFNQKNVFEKGEEGLVYIDQVECRYTTKTRSTSRVRFIFKGKRREFRMTYDECVGFEEGIYLRIFYDKEKDYLAYKRPPKAKFYFAIISFILPLYCLWHFIKKPKK